MSTLMYVVEEELRNSKTSFNDQRNFGAVKRIRVS